MNSNVERKKQASYNIMCVKIDFGAHVDIALFSLKGLNSDWFPNMNYLPLHEMIWRSFNE